MDTGIVIIKKTNNIKRNLKFSSNSQPIYKYDGYTENFFNQIKDLFPSRYKHFNDLLNLNCKEVRYFNIRKIISQFVPSSFIYSNKFIFKSNNIVNNIGINDLPFNQVTLNTIISKSTKCKVLIGMIDTGHCSKNIKYNYSLIDCNNQNGSHGETTNSIFSLICPNAEIVSIRTYENETTGSDLKIFLAIIGCIILGCQIINISQDISVVNKNKILFKLLIPYLKDQYDIPIIISSGNDNDKITAQKLSKNTKFFVVGGFNGEYSRIGSYGKSIDIDMPARLRNYFATSYSTAYFTSLVSNYFSCGGEVKDINVLIFKYSQRINKYISTINLSKLFNMKPAKVKKHSKQNHDFIYLHHGQIIGISNTQTNARGQIRYFDHGPQTIPFNANPDRDLLQLNSMVYFLIANDPSMVGSIIAVNIEKHQTHGDPTSSIYLYAYNSNTAPQGHGTVTDERQPQPLAGLNYYILDHKAGSINDLLLCSGPTCDPEISIQIWDYIKYDPQHLRLEKIVGIWSDEN